MNCRCAAGVRNDISSWSRTTNDWVALRCRDHRSEPAAGLGRDPYIPALRALPNYEVRGLSAYSAESARAAGEAFGVSAVFSDPEEMVAQPDIDVVAVTVRVLHHRELVSAALDAGKAVYCE